MNHEFDVLRQSQLRALLQSHAFQFKKQLGQNFLVDASVLEKIIEAADIQKDDGVFEVGPGAGVVTQALSERAKQVVAVEKDEALAPVLNSSLAATRNVNVLYDDVLRLDLTTVWENFADCQRVSVVANLPYYITTPILFHLLESKVRLHHIVVMVQREVAQRLVANPGTKDYGALTVAVQYYAEVDKIKRVSPGCFVPPPTVESEVVRFRIRPRPAVEVSDVALFFRVVRSAFAMRRKTLLNNLSHSFGLSKSTCGELLQASQIDPLRRGETLSLAEFAVLAEGLRRILANSGSTNL